MCRREDPVELLETGLVGRPIAIPGGGIIFGLVFPRRAVVVAVLQHVEEAVRVHPSH